MLYKSRVTVVSVLFSLLYFFVQKTYEYSNESYEVSLVKDAVAAFFYNFRTGFLNCLG